MTMAHSRRILINLLWLGWAPLALAADPSPAQPACKAIPGLQPLLMPGAAVLLGEMHGTNESPAFAADVVCLALQAGLPVTVGLEVPQEEEARFAAYLASLGTAGDRTTLLAGPFWRSTYQDGRRSQAMLSLVERLRHLRQSGAKVRVVLLDREGAAAQERDRTMAAQVKAALAGSPADFVVTLTGNVHNRVVRGTPWDKGYEPMGFLLARNGAKVTALDVSHTGGSAWFCTSAQPSDCKVQTLRARAGPGESPAVSLGGDAAPPEFHGTYNVGPLTASPPAASENRLEPNPPRGVMEIQVDAKASTTCRTCPGAWQSDWRTVSFPSS
jgi:hypothetical protein